MTVAHPLPDTRSPADAGSQPPGWRALAVLMFGGGIMHFVIPRQYERMVPKAFGDPQPLVVWSGVAEIACGVGLALPRTRRLAALGTAGLLVGVYPANLDMALRAVRSTKASPAWKAGTVARLPLQLPPIIAALKLARTARKGR